LGVQFTRKLGCEVTVLSTSDSKREDAIKLGAHEFIVTKGKWTEVAQKVDVLMMVANIKPDKWEEYISILHPRGKIILVTAGSETLRISVTCAYHSDFA
jgi:D-arabinose 1-dehydrogenase-like Zn-dependent alcohol dehydrogenase